MCICLRKAPSRNDSRIIELVDFFNLDDLYTGCVESIVIAFKRKRVWTLKYFAKPQGNFQIVFRLAYLEQSEN